jgi:hypothetical protein
VLATYRLSGSSAPKHLIGVTCPGFTPGLFNPQAGARTRGSAARKVPTLAFTPIVPNTVFVAKPSEMSYADAMLGLRIWLDHKKIQPAGFKLVTGLRIGFEIIFRTEQDALAFGGFDWCFSH